MSMFSFQAIHNFRVASSLACTVVYRLCQCSLFKQFTTGTRTTSKWKRLFIDYVNVLFSSNSQQLSPKPNLTPSCLSIMSMFSFQAIHNEGLGVLFFQLLFIDYVNVLFSSNSQQLKILSFKNLVVYRLCQCSLFKQFTTPFVIHSPATKLFIDYVNVLFSSNSQQP